MLAPLYMAEISSPEVRGSLMALEQFSIVLGAVLGFWTGFFTRNCETILDLEVPSCLWEADGCRRRLRGSAWIRILADTSRNPDYSRCAAGRGLSFLAPVSTTSRGARTQ